MFFPALLFLRVLGSEVQNLYQIFSVPRMAYFTKSDPRSPESCQNTRVLSWGNMAMFTDSL